MMKTNGWTAKEQKLLAELYTKLTFEELAERFGRKPKAIATKAHRLGVSKLPGGRGDDWTDADVRILLRFYPDHGSPKIAKLLGRSKLAVRKKASQLRVKKERK